MRKYGALLFYLFSISSVFLATPSFALQILKAKDNETVSAKITDKGLTRIFVTDDRIQAVRGTDGMYQLTKDENQGAIFIKPTLSYQRTSFNLFLSTENGHSYTLLLHPADIPAQNIELKPQTPSKKRAERWEKNMPYTQLVVTLMTDMVNAKQPDGYAIVNLEKTKPIKLSSGLTMQLLTLYQGNHLQGEFWRIKNPNKYSITVEPTDFYQDNSQAISILDETLNANDETYLYRVVDHG